MICGTTSLIAHIGYPTFTFKSPQIYNPYFRHAGIDAVVVPMGCQAADYPDFLRAVFTLTNITGALITMPHKVSTVGLLHQASTAVHIAGACNAVRRNAAGQLEGALFDGEGFVRGVLRKGLQLAGKRALVVGAGGVGSAIAASLAAAGVSELQVFDTHSLAAHQLAERLRLHYPQLQVHTGSNDSHGMALVVNATPLGMHVDDPLPIDINRLQPDCLVGEVVLRTEMTALLIAAQQRGYRVQVGSDMLFEQIPAYLEFFGLPSTTPEQLRALSKIE